MNKQVQEVIAILMPAFSHPNSDIWEGTARAAESYGLNALALVGGILNPSDPKAQTANLLYDLIPASSIDGFILHTSGIGTCLGKEAMERFRRRFADVPLVSLQMALEDTPSVLIDDFRGMYAVMQHLIEVHGYQRIAFLRGPEAHQGAHERYRAYLAALDDYGLPRDPALVAPPSVRWRDPEGTAAFLAAFGEALTTTVDAIVGASATHAYQALKLLDQMGISVPNDIALAGFDDFPQTRSIVPPLTTVRVPMERLGERAVELLYRQIHGERVPLVTIVETELVVRQSCGCPSQPVIQAALGERGTPTLAANVLLTSTKERGTALQPSELIDEQTDPIGELAARLADMLPPQPTVPEPLHRGMVEALLRDLTSPEPGPAGAPYASRFLQLLTEALHHAVVQGKAMFDYQSMLSKLRQCLLPRLLRYPEPARTQLIARAQDLLDQARVATHQAAESACRRALVEMGGLIAAATEVGDSLATATSLDELWDRLAAGLPRMGIRTCWVALREDLRSPDSEIYLLFAWSEGTRHPLPEGGLHFPCPQPFLPPDQSLVGSSRRTLVVEPLHVEQQFFGFTIMEASLASISLYENHTTHTTIYDWLATHLSDGIHNILLYAEAEDLRREAEEANQLKSQFLAMVSHDLRTPLNVIIGLTEIILSRQEGRDAELARIHACAQHLDGLIRDVLDLASSQAGRLALTREPLDLHEPLQAVAAVAEQMCRDKGLQWTTSIPDHIPKVLGDHTRLRQIVLNLISNAVRFTSRGEVKLSVEVNDGFLTISVSDTGIGVPIRDQEAIFDEFRQSGRTSSRGYGGLGLGLAISRRLVELHGGTIGVHSSGIDGEGATFYFTLPCLPPDQLDPLATEPARVISDGRTALVVTEHEAPCQLEQDLVDLGYSVRRIVCTNSSLSPLSEWLQLAVQSTPDVVILDIPSQTEKGWQLFHALKKHHATCCVPVLFYSLVTGQERGAVPALDVVEKPIDMRKLQAILERHGVVLPMPRGSMDETTGAGEMAERCLSEASESPTFLIVDDEPEIRAKNVMLIKQEFPSCRIQEAATGREALEKMREVFPDLVLLDLMMPQMDGFAVLEAMQRDPDLAVIPVVVLTARTLTEEMINRLDDNVAAILAKGIFSAVETRERLAQALKRTQRITPEAHRMVRKAMAYIHEHYAQPVTRSEIASYVNMSPRHLDRCFRAQIGLTPIQYLGRYRLRRAQQLLRSTSLSVADIAIATGFYDASHLSKVFYRELGLAPGAYRRGGR